MKNFTKMFKLIVAVVFSSFASISAIAQCVTPVITSISNTGPVCPGGTLTLKATGTVGGVSSSAVRMAGIGGNQGNRAFDQVFSSGDRAGSIARISNAQFDAIFATKPDNASKAAAIKAVYDVLMFTWASPTDNNINWGLITAYLATGGSVFVDGDYANVVRLNDGTPNSVVGVSAGTTGGCGYTIVSPAPFPALVANGVNGCFANDHLYIQSFPSWMSSYIKVGARDLAVAGIYPGGNHGRLILQGPDQDYHASRSGGPGSIERNQYQFILNQMDFLTANQAGFTWTGPNGFTSNEASPVLTNVTPAMAGTYTAILTNSNGGCYATATTEVVVNTAETPTITASGKTDLCPGSTVKLTASAGLSYLWSNGATSQSITVGTSGSYKVTVKGSNTCSATSLATIVNVNNSFCNQAPVAIAKALTVSASSDCNATASALDFNNGSTDADGDALTFTVSPFGPYALGTTPVTLTVTDTKGASSSVATSITVLDKTAPVAPVLADVIGECSASATVPTTTDNCSGIITGTTTDALTYSTPGTHVITWTFTDAAANFSIAAQNVIIKDVTAPLKPVLADVTGECSASATVPTTTDNCSGIITGTTTDALTYSTPGTHVITWTFTDAAGNFSIAAQNVIIKDVTAPLKPVLADVIGECSATVSVPNTLDNCSGTITGTTTDPLSYSSQGIYYINWTFTDAAGNYSNAVQKVIVKDVTKPVAPVLATVTGECSATVKVPTATDNCAGPVVGTTTDALTYSAQGSYIVTWSFNDGNGNITTATQNVIVKDVTKPVAPVLAMVTGECSATATVPTTTDNCAGTVTGTTSDPLTYTAQGSYVIHWSFNDGNGNITNVNQSVIVKDVTKPVAPVLATVKGECSATATVPTTTDNCAGIVTGKTTDAITYSTQGTHVITWTFNDGNGNITTATQSVIVKDVTAPVTLVKNINATLVGGSVTVTAAQLDNGSFDNCGPVTVTIPATTYSCGEYGPHNVVVTVTDANGLSSTATAVVTVIGETTTSTLASAPTSTTYTGGNANNLYLGYGAQSTTLKVTNTYVGNGSAHSYTYSWTGNGISMLSSTSSAAPMFTPTTAGTYTFLVKVTNAYGCINYATINICVKDIREVDSKKGGYTGKVYVCHVPGGDLSKANTLSISVNAVDSHLGNHTGDKLGTCDQQCGTAAGNVLASSDGPTSSNGEKVSVALESKLTAASSKLTVYPNPFGAQTTVSFTLANDEAKVSLDLFGMNGAKIQNVYSGAASANKAQSFSFSSGNLPSGTYFFRLTGGNTNLTFKVIIAN